MVGCGLPPGKKLHLILGTGESTERSAQNPPMPWEPLPQASRAPWEQGMQARTKREQGECCPYCTHFLIPAASSASTGGAISLSCSRLLFQCSSSCCWNGPSSRRSSCRQTHSLSQRLRDGTLHPQGKARRRHPPEDAASGHQAPKVPFLRSGDEPPLTLEAISSRSCRWTSCSPCSWPLTRLSTSWFLSFSSSRLASNWVRLTLLSKAPLSAF